MSDPNQSHPPLDILAPGEEEKLLEEGAQDALPEPETPLISVEFDKGDSATESLTAIEGIIRRQASRIDELKEKLKTYSDQLRSILANDETLTNVEEEVKQATRKQKERKMTLGNSAESMQLKMHKKETQESIKDLEQSLSNHLLNLYNMTGIKEFDTDDGGKREYDVKAKLRGKKRNDQ
jgi:small-conductance mechanosensitive channel